MKKLSALFLILIGFAQVANAASAKDLTGTTWEGVFAVPGATGRIRIAFHEQLNAAGEVPYASKAIFDGFLPPANWILAAVDQSCPFTPRSAAVNDTSGSISLYKCAQTLEEERALAIDPNRRKKFSLPIQRIDLDPDTNTLRMTVTLPGGIVHINYLVRAVSLPEVAPSQIQTWVSEFQ
jgi:hypothetical protein